MIQLFHSWVYIWRNWNQYLEEIPVPPCSLPLYTMYTITKMWKQPTCLTRWMDKKDVMCIYNGILFSHEKEQNPAICNNMDESGGHYAKWNKPDRGRQILLGISYMRHQKKKNETHKTESRMVVPRGCESESCSVMSNSATSWTIESMEFSRPEYWKG